MLKNCSQSWARDNTALYYSFIYFLVTESLLHGRVVAVAKPKMLSRAHSFQSVANFVTCCTSSPGWPANYPHGIECRWIIQTEPGSRVNLNISQVQMEGATHDGVCIYDALTVYAGPDDTSPQLVRLCDTHSSPTVVTSMGNRMLVTFQSDGSRSMRGFLAAYKAEPGAGCGGLMKAKSGVITSPNYPNNYDAHDDCGWLLEVDAAHTVKLMFEDFDVEPHSNCSYDYVAMYDGNSTEAPLLLMHCGRDVPEPPTVRSSGSQMYVRLKADGSVSAKGFKANFTRGCGARIVTEDGGVLTSPGYPNMWTEKDNCSWTIQGARETDRVTLHVTYMDLDEQVVSGGNCSAFAGHLAVRDGEDEEAPLLGRYCGRRAPAAITSAGSTMFVHLENRVGVRSSYSYPATQRFMATYTVEDAACGGDLSSLAGRFAAPGFPESYPPGVECIWTITAAPGNLVSLSFSMFDLEASQDCNKDYVDIFIGGPDGQHVGRFCGQEPPQTELIPSANKFWIKFNSDSAEPVGAGFIGEYHLLHGGQLEGPNGEIASPGYPRPIWTGELYAWTVTVSEGMAVDITFADFDVLTSSLQGCTHSLAIFDGPDESGRVLFSGCGSRRPPSLTSSGNVIHVQFDMSFIGYAGSKFRLRWAEVPRTRRRLTPPHQRNSTTGCGGLVQLDPAGNATLLTSPGYPASYEDNLNCEWIVQTSPDTRVQLTVLSLNLGKIMKFFYAPSHR